MVHQSGLVQDFISVSGLLNVPYFGYYSSYSSGKTFMCTRTTLIYVLDCNESWRYCLGVDKQNFCANLIAKQEKVCKVCTFFQFLSILQPQHKKETTSFMMRGELFLSPYFRFRYTTASVGICITYYSVKEEGKVAKGICASAP